MKIPLFLALGAEPRASVVFIRGTSMTHEVVTAPAKKAFVDNRVEQTGAEEAAELTQRAVLIYRDGGTLLLVDLLLQLFQSSFLVPTKVSVSV